MVDRLSSGTHRTRSLHREIPKEKPRSVTAPVRSDRSTAVANDDDPPRHRMPTMSSGLEARRGRMHDPLAEQLRMRADRELEKMFLPREGFTENADGSHTFNGTRGNDEYTVSQSSDGGVTVTNERTGKKYTLAADEAQNGISIRGGAGDDRIVVDQSVREPTERRDRFPLNIRGGSGDDTIDASASGADLAIEGDGGNDTLTGGSGDDYLQGGAGDDVADGNRGSDVIYATREDRYIDAGDDDDADMIVAEEGGVSPVNLGGSDEVFEYDPAQVDRYLEEHPELVIDGDNAFAARTRADIGVMLTTEQGRGLLDELTTALQDEGETLTFVEKDLFEGAGGGYTGGNNTVSVGQFSELYANGSSRAPLPVLFHELVHAHQDLVGGRPEGKTRFENGESVNNSELQATGLSYYDEDGLLHEPNEIPYTDNQFREELGIKEREFYGDARGEPEAYAPG